MSDFHPLQHVRLTELAEGIPWTYEALRIYANRGVLPIERHGSSLYVRRDVAAEMLSEPNSHDNLRDLIDTALDNTPTHDMLNDSDLIDTDVQSLAEEMNATEAEVKNFLNEHPDTPAAIGGVVSISAEDLANMRNVLGRR